MSCQTTCKCPTKRPENVLLEGRVQAKRAFWGQIKKCKKKCRPFLAAILKKKASDQHINVCACADFARSNYVRLLSFSNRRLTTKLRPRHFNFFYILKNGIFIDGKNFGNLLCKKKFQFFFDRPKNFHVHFIKKMKKCSRRNLIVNVSIRF